MSQTKDFLFELGTEELPPKNLLKLSQALQTEIENGLNQARLSFQDIKAYATPRRLAIKILALAVGQQDSVQERKGPALKAAFDAQGQPTKAAQAFAQSCGMTLAELDRLQTDKGAWLIARQTVVGRPTTSLMPDIIRVALAKLPIAKRMRWGAHDHEFVRPVHWLVLLFGSEVIDTNILGLTAGRETYGHRFHAPEAIALQTPGDYPEVLRSQGRVIAEFAERTKAIEHHARAEAEAVGCVAHIEADLLDEVAALTEWPVAVIGRFDTDFLALPKEVLISTMQGNQKYFPVLNSKGELAPCFITFSNLDSKNPEVIRQGNERVISPRLSDARFFWQQDRKQPLAERARPWIALFSRKPWAPWPIKPEELNAWPDFSPTPGGLTGQRPCAPRDWRKLIWLPRWYWNFPTCKALWGGITPWLMASRNRWLTLWNSSTGRSNPAPKSPPARLLRCWLWPTSWTPCAVFSPPG